MTTPDIPAAAVRVVAERMLRRYEALYEAAHMTWEDFTDDARADLTAALLHLGESRTQYGVRVLTDDGDTMTMQCSSLIDADGQLSTFDAAAQATVVHRSRITGPWKPWTGGNR